MVMVSIAVGRLFFIWISFDAAEPVFGDAAATSGISGISGDVPGVPGDAAASKSSDSVSVFVGVSLVADESRSLEPFFSVVQEFILTNPSHRSIMRTYFLGSLEGRENTVLKSCQTDFLTLVVAVTFKRRK